MSMHHGDAFSNKNVAQEAEATKECWQNNLTMYWLPWGIIDLVNQGKCEVLVAKGQAQVYASAES